ncbi:MAG: hypothetical protein KKF74_02780 [Nanoarchaeota archaeon]|nr:hypothetical protein [Nanoarchaeota archaeon]
MVPRFKAKQKKDLLADIVDELLSAPNESHFYCLISQRLRGGTGKPYQNRDNLLPEGGRYEELEVNGPADSRRIVIEMDTHELYVTRNHYQTMCYAGKPDFMNS